MIFEARAKIKQMCANTGMLEWGLRNNYRKGQNKPKGPGDGRSGQERYKRDVREVTKYVETALVLDKAMVSNFVIKTRPLIIYCTAKSLIDS